MRKEGIEMELAFYIGRLASNIKVFEGLIREVTAEQAQWKQTPNIWSILEVVNHLYDEEIYDFRDRLKATLENPLTPWPSINPQGWVTEREYNTKALSESFNRFKQERLASIEWLGTIENPHWENTYHHLQGDIKAGDLLTAWVAHDFIHIRQINRIHWAYLSMLSQPYLPDYAGNF